VSLQAAKCLLDLVGEERRNEPRRLNVAHNPSKGQLGVRKSHGPAPDNHYRRSRCSGSPR
jgi:hypothetical protein